MEPQGIKIIFSYENKRCAIRVLDPKEDMKNTLEKLKEEARNNPDKLWYLPEMDREGDRIKYYFGKSLGDGRSEILKEERSLYDYNVKEGDELIIMKSKDQTHENAMEVKIKGGEVKVKSSGTMVAIAISVLSFLLSLYAIVRPFDKEELVVTNGEELTLFRDTIGGKLVAEHDISIRNVGKKAGDIASIEGLIVSKKKDRGDNPIFKKYFYEINYSESKDFPFGKNCIFFNWVIFPNEWYSYRLSLNQEKPRDFDYYQKEFDNFDAGDYEYLLILKNDDKKCICVKHYQFSINQPEADSLKKEVPVYFSLNPLQDKKRINELLKIIDALKIAKPMSNKIGK